jgi:hypothetical protein
MILAQDEKTKKTEIFYARIDFSNHLHPLPAESTVFYDAGTFFTLGGATPLLVGKRGTFGGSCHRLRRVEFSGIISFLILNPVAGP